ncbi:MAG TPA: tetratricopeptide repeat protein [Pyrinomonadaceae bacterium]|nr:tetratricopeptide repeat protein [Pyrinomonadaceae bacterium]
MIKHSLVVLSLSLVFVLGASPIISVQSTELTDAEIAALDAASAEAAQDLEVEPKPSGGNRFVRVLKAPFKAIGRLFGRGGNKDDNKLHRLSKKDVKKFESAPITRVVDARTAPTAPTQTSEATPPTGPAATEDPAQALSFELLERGRRLLDSNNPNGAIMALSTAVSLNPRLRDAHNLLGIAYENKGMRRQALLSLEFALKGDNDKAEHLNNYGYLLSKNGEYHKAIKYLKKAVKLSSSDQRFLNNLAMAQVQLGKFDDAYENFARAVGEFEGHMNIATRLQRLGKEKDAIKHLEKARVLQPNNTDTLARLVTLYGQMGEPEKATEANKSLLAIQASANAAQQRSKTEQP